MDNTDARGSFRPYAASVNVNPRIDNSSRARPLFGAICPLERVAVITGKFAIVSGASRPVRGA